ncbi:hypothetical protein [Brevundimonas sp.]|uniref:hypothetical protein n=1 Tax=Brevundimonas sp. TaxID=1871086 RepID=UPI003A8FFDF3
MQVGALLEPGEHLVWSGAPGARLFLSRRQAVAAAFLVLHGALALLLVLTVQGLFGFGPVTVGAVALAGLSLVVQGWRFWTWWSRRFGEHYVLTDSRVLVVERDGTLRSETSLLKAHLFRLSASLGGGSTVVLGQDEPLWTPPSSRSLNLKPAADAPRLSGLDDGGKVFALIRKTAEARERFWAASANEAAPGD